MHSPQIPIDWRKITFNMLPKHARAKDPAEYRPIASSRLLYKTFAYMILSWKLPSLKNNTDFDPDAALKNIW